MMLFYDLLFFLSRFIYSIFINMYFNEIPGFLQDCITLKLFDILAMYLHISNKYWIYFIGLSTCCDYVFFHLLQSVFQLSNVNLSKSNQFLLYCILPVNSISSLSGSKHFYYTFYLLLISICIQKQVKEYLVVMMFIYACFYNPYLCIIVGFIYFPMLFCILSPIIFLLYCIIKNDVITLLFFNVL